MDRTWWYEQLDEARKCNQFADEWRNRVVLEDNIRSEIETLLLHPHPYTDDKPRHNA